MTGILWNLPRWIKHPKIGEYEAETLSVGEQDNELNPPMQVASFEE